MFMKRIRLNEGLSPSFDLWACLPRSTEVASPPLPDLIVLFW